MLKKSSRERSASECGALQHRPEHSDVASGENALRVLREWRGKTQLYIAHKTKIGQGYISDLENGRRKGTTAA
jgi:predicted transcriptional regulator